MTLEELEARITRVEDILEIWKLQSKYSHYHHMCYWDKIPDLFAQKTPGVTVEVSDSGVFEGIEGVREFYASPEGPHKLMSSKPGWIGLHMTVNPVIEISKDGKTAKGLWHSPGLLMGPYKEKWVPLWVYGKYANDYVKEDGKWKFWHFHFYLTFRCPYKEGWVEEPVVVSMRGWPGFAPDKPTTYYRPYQPDKVTIFEPPPPEPEE